MVYHWDYLKTSKIRTAVMFPEFHNYYLQFYGSSLIYLFMSYLGNINKFELSTSPNSSLDRISGIRMLGVQPRLNLLWCLQLAHPTSNKSVAFDKWRKESLFNKGLIRAAQMQKSISYQRGRMKKISKATLTTSSFEMWLQFLWVVVIIAPCVFFTMSHIDRIIKMEGDSIEYYNNK